MSKQNPDQIKEYQYLFIFGDKDEKSDIIEYFLRGFFDKLEREGKLDFAYNFYFRESSVDQSNSLGNDINLIDYLNLTRKTIPIFDKIQFVYCIKSAIDGDENVNKKKEGIKSKIADSQDLIGVKFIFSDEYITQELLNTTNQG